MGRNKVWWAIILLLLSASGLSASEADINLPDLSAVTFPVFGKSLSGYTILWVGLLVCLIGVVFGLIQYKQTKALPVHKRMGDVSNIIWETCKTYLAQQGRFLVILWVLIAGCMAFYFLGLQHNPNITAAKKFGNFLIILLCSILGILGSYGVAWFGIRINTVANSRTAFSALKGNPLATLLIPLKSGMSVGLLLVSVELFFMICILAFLDPALAGPCFIGFAIGESLGASALRICGGIFTKIADIGADLMKIVFQLPEDDPRNPGVIADCTGDNAGDSVGPTADGFETYGVTGVALIAFLALALASNPALCATLIIWLFAMRTLLVAGNFSGFWTGLCILTLMFGAYLLSGHAAVQAMMPEQFRFAAPIFAFGLVAFGFLGMGPVTIAVDSFGPVTDNAQSVYELSQIEARRDINAQQIKSTFGFEPDFENAKYQLEKGDGAGNTFKATAKPVLIGTAV